jgi:hypothetical protein
VEIASAVFLERLQNIRRNGAFAVAGVQKTTMPTAQPQFPS